MRRVSKLNVMTDCFHATVLPPSSRRTPTRSCHSKCQKLFIGSPIIMTSLRINNTTLVSIVFLSCRGPGLFMSVSVEV